MADSKLSRDALADRQAVLAAVDAFYAALQGLDFPAMCALWAQRPQDVCVHPGWEVLHGWPAIRESWRAIFANTGFMRAWASEVQVELLGDLARVTNVENLMTVAGAQTAHSQVAATNLFLRTPDGWRMILHHGSPVAMRHSVAELDPDEPAH